MKYTYDLNTNRCLILTCTEAEKTMIRALRDDDTKGFDRASEFEALEHLMANSELDWIGSEEIGALTDAPILGLRDEDGKPTAAWGFMDYALRSFLSDLVEYGKAVFIS